MTSREVETFLEHFGVKGMRWGVRQNHASSTKGPNRKERKAAKKQAQNNRTTIMTGEELASNILAKGGIPRNAMFRELELGKK